MGSRGCCTPWPGGIVAIMLSCLVSGGCGRVASPGFSSLIGRASALGLVVVSTGDFSSAGRGVRSGRLTLCIWHIDDCRWFWCVWKRMVLRCSSYLSGFLFMRTAPNHDNMRGPEFLTPSSSSHGDITLVSCTRRPCREKIGEQMITYT